MDDQENCGILGIPEGGGARGQDNSRRGNQKSRGRGKDKDASAKAKEAEPIPEDLVDPCKVFVSNLRPRVTGSMLREALSHYAAVEKVTIIKDKHTMRSKGYGFVKVKTQEDVEKLLGLQGADCYIQGREIVIQLARKKIRFPGDSSYVRRPLPDREFDLSQTDPSQPSIHMLVDDVIFKIFSYLPIRNLIRCEGVCRRWQMLVHMHFSKMTTLEINESSLEIAPPFTRPIISKLLILSGPNLKSLKVERVEFATQGNILKIISQLCPVLEHLDVSKACGINFLHISWLTARCKYIKSFIAESCTDFDEKALRKLLVSYPQLERLNVSGTSLYGKNFNLLPATLKELCIERIPQLCENGKKITVVADKCPNLEVLQMRTYLLSKDELEYIGKNCHNLTKLSVSLRHDDATESFLCFKNLKDLTLRADCIDLSKLVRGLLKMEVLSVDTRDIRSHYHEVDFSLLENLKSVTLDQTELTKTSLLTLGKCKHLEKLHLKNCYTLPQEVPFRILTECTKLKRIACPGLQAPSSFITMVDEIMKSRPGKLVIEWYQTLGGTRPQDVQYDKNKIEFDYSCSFPYLYDHDSDSDDSDDSNLNFYGLGYDRDGDIADEYIFHDELDADLLDAALMLAAWNVHDPDFH